MLNQRMLSKFAILVWVFAFCLFTFAVSSVKAAPVNPEDRLFTGIVINEILADPSTGADGCEASNTGFDTNSDGCVNQADEFVELYNGLDESVEIGTWSLWTNGGETVFTFPDGAEIDAYGYVVVTADWDESITGEISTLNGADVYSADQSAGILADAGDNIILLDPDFEEYIHVYYTGAGASQTEPIDNPINNYTGFYEDAFLIGSVGDFGVAEAGVSRVRRFSADTEILRHTDVDGEAASPGDHYTAVILHQTMSQTTGFGGPMFIILVILLASSTLYCLRPTAKIIQFDKR